MTRQLDLIIKQVPVDEKIYEFHKNNWRGHVNSQAGQLNKKYKKWKIQQLIDIRYANKSD